MRARGVRSPRHAPTTRILPQYMAAWQQMSRRNSAGIRRGHARQAAALFDVFMPSAMAAGAVIGLSLASMKSSAATIIKNNTSICRLYRP